MIGNAILLAVGLNRSYLVYIYTFGMMATQDRKYMKKGEEIIIPFSEEKKYHEFLNEVVEVKGLELKGRTADGWIYVLNKPGNYNYINIEQTELAG